MCDLSLQGAREEKRKLLEEEELKRRVAERPHIFTDDYTQWGNLRRFVVGEDEQDQAVQPPRGLALMRDMGEVAVVVMEKQLYAPRRRAKSLAGQAATSQATYAARGSPTIMRPDLGRTKQVKQGGMHFSGRQTQCLTDSTRQIILRESY